jgi:hypothetical protein
MPELTACVEDQESARALSLMHARQLRQLAVLGRDQCLVGFISLRDVAAPGHEGARRRRHSPAQIALCDGKISAHALPDGAVPALWRPDHGPTPCTLLLVRRYSGSKGRTLTGGEPRPGEPV